MPNHVTTKLRIADLGGANLADVQASFLNDNRKIDFNVIGEMPKCLQGFEPHSGIISRAEMALGLMQNPDSDPENFIARLHLSNGIRDATTKAKVEDIPAIVRAISNHAECGYTYWYDWANDNWGTKWNAYHQPDDGFAEDETEFEFQTAWSHPRGLIETLSARNPSVVFQIEYADEDLGSNCGSYNLIGGKATVEKIAPRWGDQSEEQKKSFTEFAFKICNGDEDPASHGYDKNWQYSEEVYDAYHEAS